MHTDVSDESLVHLRQLPKLEYVDVSGTRVTQEGAGGALPWMQQLPDPTSSAMWNLPLEIDPRTAAELGLATGDTVRATSAQGVIEAPAYVNPAAIPGVVSMALGQGHTHSGRYAAGRGANPLDLAASAKEQATGVLAFGSARVRLEKVAGGGGIVQFARTDRELPQQRP
jgi:molybdopterin-containing oxidoreductase family iron-sulfur binding subunit